ncbi:unnamed protein product [Rotaria sordida]|uniref:MULE transposase domain-containing protein n=1 Tax=Rotaria sordida TaxID=392033 RepID=A0A819CPR0_9BILA|nr:unnamed protein product [Rotaria sordida]CAF3811354.1 unnamed protein product [Rotaria sordida]
MSAEFVESTHGKKQLCYLGYRYCFKRQNQNGSQYWTCVKCNATATSYPDMTVEVRDNHTHLPDETDKEVLQIRKNLKRKIIEQSGPIDRIVEEEFHKINIKSHDLLINLPSINILKNTLQKQRRKMRPPVPQTIEQLPFSLPDAYCKTTTGEWFLLYDGLLGGTRSLIFSIYNDIIYLLQQENWYSDGTFYTCPSIFYQMYSIHAYYDGMSTPCIFALLGGKSEQIYFDLFAVIFRKMMELNLFIKLRTITIDYEVAVSNVFTKHYPTVVVRGCLFHYGQALFRKFVDLGSKTAYKNDENLRDWFRSFAALSLLPLQHMLRGLQFLISTRPNYSALQQFLDYHHNTFGPCSKFPPHMYNHYRNITPRTINYLEGRHGRLKKHVNSPHPNIYRAIDLLQKEQSLASIARLRDDLGAPTPKRRKNNLISDECLMKLWNRYDEGRVDILMFLKAAGMRYFQRPSKA